MELPGVQKRAAAKTNFATAPAFLWHIPANRGIAYGKARRDGYGG